MSNGISITTMDQLAFMSDEEINNRYTFLMGLRNRRNASEDMQMSAEVEMCYIHRELELRQIRFEAHQKYLATHSEYSQQY